MKELNWRQVIVDMQGKAIHDGLVPAQLLVHPEFNLGMLLMDSPVQISQLMGMRIFQANLDRDYVVAITDLSRPTSYVIAADINGNLEAFWYRWE